MHNNFDIDGFHIAVTATSDNQIFSLYGKPDHFHPHCGSKKKVQVISPSAGPGKQGGVARWPCAGKHLACLDFSFGYFSGACPDFVGSQVKEK